MPTTIAAEQVVLGSLIASAARVTSDIPRGIARAFADHIHEAPWRVLTTCEAPGTSNAAAPLANALVDKPLLE